MSSIGPQLPPHLAKRKRSPDDENDGANVSPPSKTSRGPDPESDSEDDAYGPSAPKSTLGPTLPPRTVAAGPSLPPTNSDDTSKPTTTLAGPAPPPKRVLGPAPPPASLSTRPETSPNSDDSSDDDDDDYGPALPSATTSHGPSLPSSHRGATAPHQKPEPQQEEEAPLKRDDWMLAPPPSSTGYQERDPTKLKARKFASGSSATTRPKDSGPVSTIWTETPEEKARRLADAVLGRGGGDADAATAAASSKSSRRRKGEGRHPPQQDEKQIREFTQQTRGRSLYEEHQAARKAGKAASSSGSGSGARKGGEGDEEEDDPSKRAFDREKDMAIGGRITASQRKELLNRASDFGGRFSKGNYL